MGDLVARLVNMHADWPWVEQVDVKLIMCHKSTETVTTQPVLRCRAQQELGKLRRVAGIDIPVT